LRLYYLCEGDSVTTVAGYTAMTQTKHILHREGTASKINPAGMSVGEYATKLSAINKKLANKTNSSIEKGLADNREINNAKYKAKQEALNNKTYYNLLAAKYLTSAEYEQYAKYMGHFKINAETHNKLARKFINEMLAPYNIDIDTLAGTMSPFEWKEYKENVKKYPELAKPDAEAEAAVALARDKDTFGKVNGPYQKGPAVAVLGNEDTGIKPMLKYSWDPVSQQYAPDTGEDDVDADFWEDSKSALTPYNYDVEWKYKD